MFANVTPYAALAVPTMDAAGRDVVVVVVKATFHLATSDRVVAADEQVPIRVNDEPYDPDREHSSIKYPSDICIEKSGTDVVVVGEAISRTPTRVMDVAVKVREAMAPLRVHGERLFYKSLSSVSIGAAAPFERKPIVYERAYGGISDDCSIVEMRNWSGVGVAKRAADLVDKPAPQIEHPARPHKSASDRHPPVGYGAIPSHWTPRREAAGTFDAAWRATRMPMMPADFDVAHYNVAHPSLHFAEALRADDSVGLVGMSPDGAIHFRIPTLPVVIRARFDGAPQAEVRPAIDTVLVEPEPRRVEITLRRAFPMGRRKVVLRELTVDLD